MTAFLSDVQSSNAHTPIVSVAAGTFISFMDSQPAKALAPMLVTPSGISTSNFLQS